MHKPASHPRKNRSAWLIFFAASAACVLAACKKELPQGPPSYTAPPPTSGPSVEDKYKAEQDRIAANLQYIPDLGQGSLVKSADGEVWVQYPGGLMIHDLLAQQGVPPQVGQVVKLAYRVMLPSDQPGTERVMGQATASAPLEFRLGSKDLVKGLSMGISTMNVHGKRRIYVPASLAYGADGNARSGIRPNQPLIFEVELLSVTGYPIPLPPPTVPVVESQGPSLPTAATAPATHPAPTGPATKP